MNKERALEILKENIKNENLRKHHYAVAAAMRALAEQFGKGAEGKELGSDQGEPSSEEFGTEELQVDKWEIVGLLHDADYEETKDDPERHALVIAGKLEQEGVDEEIINAIKAHNYEELGIEPESKMEWALISCDDLTGLIIAVALVHPEKLAGVTVESVLKKFPSKSFAAGADRERIKLCEEKLGITLEEFVGICLTAMQNISDDLGL